MDGWELSSSLCRSGHWCRGCGVSESESAFLYVSLLYFFLVICSRYYRSELLSGCFSVSHRVLNKYPPRGIIKLKIELFFSLHLEGYGRDLECGVLVVNSASEPVE